jgi:hypothetical protein
VTWTTRTARRSGRLDRYRPTRFCGATQHSFTPSLPTEVDCVRTVPGGQCLDHRAPGAAVLAKSVKKYNRREPGIPYDDIRQPDAVHLVVGQFEKGSKNDH